MSSNLEKKNSKDQIEKVPRDFWRGTIRKNKQYRVEQFQILKCHMANFFKTHQRPNVLTWSRGQKQ